MAPRLSLPIGCDRAEGGRQRGKEKGEGATHLPPKIFHPEFSRPRREGMGKKTLAEEDEDVSWKTRERERGRFFPTDGLGGKEGGP